MLPKHERRRLEEIENRFSVEDPEFARKLTDKGRARWYSTWLSTRSVLAVVAALTAAACLALGEGAGFVVAGILAVVLIALRNWTLSAE